MLHQVGVSFDLYCDARKHKIKGKRFYQVCLVLRSGMCDNYLNPLTPNDPYRGRTAPLTSKRCILYIYSTNTGTAHFKHGI